MPEEQRGLLQQAVRPGGYADRLATVLWLLTKARNNMWIFVMLPAAELVLALFLSVLSCGTSLAAWLRGDSILALCLAAMIYYVCYTLAPVYHKVQTDTMGALQRWQAAAHLRPVWERLEAVVPGVDPEVWRAGGMGLLCCIVLLAVGAMWLLIGALEILGTMAYGCSGAVLFVCVVLIGVRLSVAVSLVLLAAWHLRLRGPPVGAAAGPVPAAEAATDAESGDGGSGQALAS